MGVTAALKGRRINDNVERILALELMAAAQGVDFRRALMGADATLGAGTQPVYALIRQHVPFIQQDSILYTYINAMIALVREGAIVRASRSGVGVRV